MSDWFTEHNDWRKQAAMTAANDLDIEKAVADQASGFVENKLGPLMKGDHPLGFEIVKKNDENTRIVGVFAFKIDKSLLFAPVFFINGEIKGPLLYRCDTKTFVPANKEWAEYLISSQEMSEGKGRDRSRRFENPPLVQMQRIAFKPATIGKSASAADSEEINADEYASEFNTSYNNHMKQLVSASKTEVKDSDGREHKIESTPASGKTRGHARRDGEAHARRVFEAVTKKAAADYESKQKDVPIKEIKVKATKITGKYTVKDMDDDAKQPETTVGELKVASYEDGTVRMCFDGEAEEFLTREGAEDILTVKSATVQLGGDAVSLGEDATAQIKKAFLTDVSRPETAAMFDEMLKAAESIAEPSNLLRDLLADEVFGEKATETILKAADAHFEFTEQLARLCDGDATKLFSPRLEKKAVTVTKEIPTLSLVYDQDCMSKQAAVSKEYFRDGFFIQDTRPEETLSVVYEDSPSAITSPSEAGEYAVVANDGKLVKGVFVGHMACTTDRTPIATSDEYVYHNPMHAQKTNTYYVLVKDKKMKVCKNVMGMQMSDATTSSVPQDSVRAGKAYLLLPEGSDVLVGPIVVKSVDTVDGVKTCKVYVASDWEARQGDMHITQDALRTMTINPDRSTTDLDELNLTGGARFIEVGIKPRHYSTDDPITLEGVLNGKYHGGTFDVDRLELDAGAAGSVDNFIFNQWSIPKVKIHKVLFGEEDTTPKFAIEALQRKSAAMNKMCMMVKLARDLNISASKVYDIMEKVAANGSHEFYIEGLNKAAAMLHLVDQPQFDEKFNSEFGVPIQPTKVYHLRTQGVQMFEPPSSIGDAMNPTTATGLPNLTVATTAPEDLRALADTYSLPHVFDHAAVGTLANAFNAIKLMDRYIPAIEDAVDALGRTKFLLYWMPEDFERAYGQDDMINLEAQIDAEFSSLGSLLMKLLKKSDALKKSDGTDNESKDKE